MVLEDGCRLIFHYVQQLHHHLSKGDRMKRVWDPTYTLVYRDSDSASSEPGWSVPYICRHVGKEKLPKSMLIQYLQRKAQVRGGGRGCLGYHSYKNGVLVQRLEGLEEEKISPKV